MKKIFIRVLEVLMMLLVLSSALCIFEIYIPDENIILKIVLELILVVIAIALHVYIFLYRLFSHTNKLLGRLDKTITVMPGIEISSNLSAFSLSINSQILKIEKVISDYNDQILKKYYYLDNNSILKEVIISLNNLMYEIDNREELFTVILEKAIKSIPQAESGSILSLHDGEILKFEAAVGFDMEELRKAKMNLKDCYLWKESHGHPDKPCIISHKIEYDQEQKNKENFKIFKNIGNFNYQSTITSPIIIENELFGIINFDSYMENAFKKEDIILIEYFSSQVGAVIKNHNQIEKAIYRARYDSLTGIHNREFFEEIINISIKQGLRQNTGFILVIMDLNDFKVVNDTQGHLTGDRLLKYFVEVILKFKRDSDLFARWGGDEFVAAYYNSSRIDIKEHMSKVRNYFSNHLFTDGSFKYEITFSYGIASFPDEASDLINLTKVADMKMYENKKNK